jgi:Fic family protein
MRGSCGASLHHAHFIKIHPFLDGNGRTGRICVNYFAARYGLKFIEIERPKQRDYEATLGIFIREGRISPLIEFLRPLLFPPGTA